MTQSSELELQCDEVHLVLLRAVVTCAPFTKLLVRSHSKENRISFSIRIGDVFFLLFE